MQKLAVSLQSVRFRQLGPIDLNVRQGERVALIGAAVQARPVCCI
jgi:ATP-binding cassette subfamily C protein CydC